MFEKIVLKSAFLFCLLLNSIVISFAQIKTPAITLEGGGFVSAGENTPFRMISNQYGKYSSHWYNVFYGAELKAGFDSAKNVDYSYGIELFNRIDDHYNLMLHQAYLDLKFWFVHLNIGREEEVYGNQYNPLSTGNILWSGNAPPMPKINIRVPEFTPVPFTTGYLEFKGNLAHGWFEKDRYVKGVLMHHKSLIGRIGGDLPVNIHYGMHHFAQWGGESPDVGKLPSDLRAYKSIFFAEMGAYFDTTLYNEALGRYGNHIGSRNIGIDVKLKNSTVGFYWQTIFEDTSGKRWRNIKDGLWGIYWENKRENPLIKAIAFEYINTTDQSGPTHDYYDEDSVRVILSGNDNYFNNAIYKNGWTYNEFTLGSPYITSPFYFNRETGLYNNKLKAHIFGIQGSIKRLSIDYRFNFSHSINYGLNTGNRYAREFWNTYDPPKEHWGFFLHGGYHINKKSYLSLIIGVDSGKMYGDNMGLMISYKYQIL